LALLKIDENVAKEQIEYLRQLRSQRNNEKVHEILRKLKDAARGTENLMPYIVDAVREYASIGEIIASLKEIFGIYVEDSIF
jgi:methylmalonyl-CoA mutase N-terminal domain/subunit